LDCLKEEEDEEEEEDTNNDNDDDDDDKDDNDVAYLMNLRGKQSQLEVVTNLSTFLDELLEGKKTAEIEQIITATLNETIRDAEMKRSHAIKKLLLLVTP
jgi:hypothetical protein